MDGDARREAYNADITYGTNNEFGFDYLRDNMVTYKDNMVQRGHAYAIVDEVDSILIDEARTPLIISGRGEDSSSLYTQVDRFVRTLRKSVVVELEDKVETDEQADGDYIVDEKHKTCTLTAKGIKKAEEYFKIENLAAAENMTLAHHIDQAIKAYGVMQRDIDYVVKDGEVLIVDEFTGRLMIGRRYKRGPPSGHRGQGGREDRRREQDAGDHHLPELLPYVQEAVRYDRYGKDGGHRVHRDLRSEHRYRPHQPSCHPQGLPGCHLQDHQRQIQCRHPAGHGVPQERPAGPGGYCQRREERDPRQDAAEVHPRLQRAERQDHEREAEIVAQAGKKGAITIATNMAGRGTDIMLGGNAEYMAKAQMRKEHFCEKLLNPEKPEEALPAAVELLLIEADGHGETADANILAVRKRFDELYAQYKPLTEAEAEEVRAAGGLFIIGTERHESRRIDNQLRGRAGRQGDPVHPASI